VCEHLDQLAALELVRHRERVRLHQARAGASERDRAEHVTLHAICGLRSSADIGRGRGRLAVPSLLEGTLTLSAE
jgi:hypothetical protein